MIHHNNTFLRSALVQNPFAFGELGPQAQDVLRIEEEFPLLFQSNPPKQLDQVLHPPNLPTSALPKQLQKPTHNSRLTHSARPKPSSNNTIGFGINNATLPREKVKDKTVISKSKRKENTVPIREICKPIRKEPNTFVPCSKGTKCISETMLKQNPSIIKPSSVQEFISNPKKQKSISGAVQQGSIPHKNKQEKLGALRGTTIDKRIIESVKETEHAAAPSVTSVYLQPSGSNSKFTTGKGFIRPKSGRRFPKKHEVEVYQETIKAKLSSVELSSFPRNLVVDTKGPNANQLITAGDLKDQSATSSIVESYSDSESNEIPIPKYFPPLGLSSGEQLEYTKILAQEYELRGVFNRKNQLSTIDSAGSKEKSVSQSISSISAPCNLLYPEVQLRNEYTEEGQELTPQNIDDQTCGSFIVFPESFEIEFEQANTAVIKPAIGLMKVDAETETELPNEAIDKLLEAFALQQNLLTFQNPKEDLEVPAFEERSKKNLEMKSSNVDLIEVNDFHVIEHVTDLMKVDAETKTDVPNKLMDKLLETVVLEQMQNLFAYQSPKADLEVPTFEERSKKNLEMKSSNLDLIEVNDFHVTESLPVFKEFGEVEKNIKRKEQIQKLNERPVRTDKGFQTDMYTKMPLPEVVSKIVIEHRFSGEKFHSRVKSPTNTDSENPVPAHRVHATEKPSTGNKHSRQKNLVECLDKYTEVTPPVTEPVNQLKENVNVKQQSRRFKTTTHSKSTEELTDCTSFSEFMESEHIRSKKSPKASLNPHSRPEMHSKTKTKTLKLKPYPTKEDKGTSMSEKQVTNMDKSTSCYFAEPVMHNRQDDSPSETSTGIQYNTSLSLGEALYDSTLSPGEITSNFFGPSSTLFTMTYPNDASTELDISNSYFDLA